MNIRNPHTRFWPLVLLTIVIAVPLRAQISSDIPLVVADNGSGTTPGRDTLYFGFHPAATNGRDAALGEDEQPPTPPEGVFDTRWVNVASSKDFGQGVKRNYHQYVAAQQSDTFRLRVQPGFLPGGGGYPVTISWPQMSTYFTAATLRFVDGDGTAQTKDMMEGNSFTFSNPSAVSSSVTIVTSGPRGSSGVSMAEAILNFKLTTAPNPVRRDDGTTLGYVLPYPAHVTVQVFNTLGQNVATVVDEDATPGRYAHRIETVALPAGSYYCVINAGRFASVCTLILVD